MLKKVKFFRDDVKGLFRRRFLVFIYELVIVEAKYRYSKFYFLLIETSLENFVFIDKVGIFSEEKGVV